MIKNFTQILFIIFFPTFLLGQTDSVVLTTDQLILQDIQPYESKIEKQKVFAATGSLKNIEDLPFTIYVISKKEIRDNGYRTLVDALKMQPGIRVSQPGSALEGETFLMRGLSGNVYAKILLNGRPIKPFIVKGMPIGAQLPIQQAERIEIIYGAMGSMYGTNASSGIINIVIEETARPVYTQANLSMGSQEFANLDISFGGRLGKRKQTLRYALYGNYTFRGDQKIQHTNDSLFNFDRYPSFNFETARSQNYVTIGQDQVVNKLPHQSRMVGLDLAYRSMKFSIQSMYRRDHSSLGLSPVAASYANPLNFVGERIINANFSITKNFRKWGLEANVGYLQYKMDSQSSFDLVYSTTSRLLNQFSFEESFDVNTQLLDFVKYDSLTRSHNQRYFNNSRFSYSESNDFRIDLAADFILFRNFEIKIGNTSSFRSTTPMTNFSRVPLGNDFQTLTLSGIHLASNTALRPFVTVNLSSFENSTFVQFYLKHKKLTLTGGVQWFQYQAESGRFDNDDGRIKFDDVQNAVNPRIGANLKLAKLWSVRAYYSTAIRIPSPFHSTNSFLVSGGEATPIQVALTKIDPELTQNMEIGFRWRWAEYLYFDVSGFYTSTSNRLANRITRVNEGPNNPFNYFVQGYLNSELTTSLLGFQADLIAESNLLDVKFNMALSYDRTSGDPNNDFVENVGWSELPRMIRKTRLVFYPTKRISLIFDTVFIGKSPNRVKGRSDLSKYRSIDILAKYQINRNFRIFYKINNIFNREYSGLNATGNLDDLIYNPQHLRNFRVGMSYRID